MSWLLNESIHQLLNRPFVKIALSFTVFESRIETRRKCHNKHLQDATRSGRDLVSLKTLVTLHCSLCRTVCSCLYSDALKVSCYLPCKIPLWWDFFRLISSVRSSLIWTAHKHKYLGCQVKPAKQFFYIRHWPTLSPPWYTRYLRWIYSNHSNFHKTKCCINVFDIMWN